MPKYKMFAAIEAGSSSISMKIVRFDKTNGIIPVDHVTKNLSLGRQTYKNGKIPYTFVEELCSIFNEFTVMMKEYGVAEYIACATSAIREASNSEYVIDQVNLRTGIKINILNNEEERFLHNKALALKLDGFDNIIEESAALIDLSSGSVQISTYENGRLYRSENILMGPIRLLEKFSGIENRSEDFVKTIDEYIAVETSKILRNFDYSAHKNFIICGISVKYLKKISGCEEFTIKIFNELCSKLKYMSADDLSRDYQIPREQGIIMLASALIYRNLLKHSSSNRIFAPEIGLCDGICVEYAEKSSNAPELKHIFADDIISGAQYYAKRYNCDKKHYTKVLEYACSIAKYMSKRFGIEKNDITLLSVAAIFADAGYYLSCRHYSRYSRDIFRASPVLGISQKEKDVIAYTLLFHADGVPLDSDQAYQYLPKSRKLTISKLSAILAIAKTLDEGRKQKIKSIRLSYKNDTLIIKGDYSEDISLERYEFEKAAEFFEDVFGVKTRLV